MKKSLIQLVICGALLAETACAKTPDTYMVTIGNYKQEYPVIAPKGNPAVKIVYVADFNDNFKLGQESARALVQKLKEAKLIHQIQAIVVPGDKANMLATLLYLELLNAKRQENKGQESLEFAILRPTEKGQIAFTQAYNSITGGNKELRMRPDQVARLKDKTVLIFDDVISSGGTISGVAKLVEKIGCKIAAYACVGTEGNEREKFEGKPLFHLTHLPVFVEKS